MTNQQAIELAGFMYLQSRYDDAERVLRAQLETSDEDASILFNLALLRSIQGDFDACTEYCERSLRVSPGFREATDLLAYQRLRDGRWAEGFQLAEARFMKPQPIPYFDFPFAIWDGSREMRRLLVWGEQGLGDTVQFGSLLPALKNRGHDVTVLVDRELYDLFSESRLADRVFRVGDVARFQGVEGRDNSFMVNPAFLAEVPIDAHLPIMSLGRILELTPQRLDVDRSVPFLSPSSERIMRAKEIFSQPSVRKGVKVGLVWAGGAARDPEYQKTNLRRNIPLPFLKPLLDCEGASFFSFQKGFDAIARHEFPQIQDVPLTESFSDTAALLLQLDLLITVDTSIAHVAGGLGVPVWLLNRWDSCWRWGRTGQDSLWYPTMRIFRQNGPGRWENVVSDVLTALRALIDERGRR